MLALFLAVIETLTVDHGESMKTVYEHLQEEVTIKTETAWSGTLECGIKFSSCIIRAQFRRGGNQCELWTLS